MALDTEDLPAGVPPLPADAPVLILLPGLTGGSEDSYVQHAVVSTLLLFPTFLLFRSGRRWGGAAGVPGGWPTRHPPPLPLRPWPRQPTRPRPPTRRPPPAQVHAREAGIRAVVFNSRGTSGSPVTTAQFYSASYTEDMR